MHPQPQYMVRLILLTFLVAVVLAACSPAPAPSEERPLFTATPADEDGGEEATEEPQVTEEAEEAEATEEAAFGEVDIQVRPLPDAPLNPRQALAVDAQGRQTVFTTDQVIFNRSQSTQGELNTFLQQYGGTVVADGTLPNPATLVARNTTRAITDFGYVLIQVNTGRANLNTAADNLAELGYSGSITFSSEAGRALIAIVAEAQTNGYPVAPNIAIELETVPITGTDEGPAGSGSGRVDAFTLGYNQLTNMPRAWQLADALGFTRHVRVAVIDSGFGVGVSGYSNPDFPAAANIPQWDITDEDEDASGPGDTTGWHGTQVAGIASAYLNNEYGTAGTGGQVIDLVLLRVGDEDGYISWFHVAKAIHQSIELGAEIINLSMAGTCDSLCQALGNFNGVNAVSDALDLAYEQNVVVIGASGNGGTDQKGDNLNTVSVMPCAYQTVLCVGALDGATTGSYEARKTRAVYSNYGTAIDIWAPGALRCTVLPEQAGANPCTGTSAAAPYVTGVVALLLAANPDLDPDDIRTMLNSTALKDSTDSEVNRAGILDAHRALLAALGNQLPTDQYEPNNTANRATSLRVNAGTSTFPDLTINTAADTDHYTFQITATTTVSIAVNYARSYGEVQIQLLGESGSVIATSVLSARESNGLGYDQQVITTTLPPGRYTVVVRGMQSGMAVYDLEIRR